MEHICHHLSLSSIGPYFLRGHIGWWPSIQLTPTDFTSAQASEEQTSKLLPDPFERKKFGTKILGI